MKNFSRNEIEMAMAKFERDFSVRQQTMIRVEIFKEEKKKADALDGCYRRLRRYVEGCLTDLLSNPEDPSDERDAVRDFAGDRSIDMFPNINEDDREYVINKCVTYFCGETA